MSDLLCDACMTGAILAEATHVSRYGDGYAWCDDHKLPGDVPLDDLTPDDRETMIRRAVQIPSARPTTQGTRR